MDAMTRASLASLLPKKLSDLTAEELGEAASAFNINVTMTEELRTAALLMLKGENLDTVADLLRSPDTIKSIVSFFHAPQPPQDDQRVMRCPHCGDFFLSV